MERAGPDTHDLDGALEPAHAFARLGELERAADHFEAAARAGHMDAFLPWAEMFLRADMPVEAGAVLLNALGVLRATSHPALHAGALQCVEEILDRLLVLRHEADACVQILRLVKNSPDYAAQALRRLPAIARMTRARGASVTTLLPMFQNAFLASARHENAGPALAELRKLGETTLAETLNVAIVGRGCSTRQRPKIRRISVFLPRPTPFYEGLLPQMMKGFEAEGIEASGLCRHLDATALREWCEAYRPDAILEMNRPGCEVPFLPRGIAHLVWVVDLNGRPLSHFEGSAATYLFGPGWARGYPHAGFHRWMGPGTDPEVYAARTLAPSFAIAGNFAGHIPAPWTEDELARDLTGGAGSFRFRDLIGPLAAWLTQSATFRVPRAYDALDVAKILCREASGCELVVDDRATYDIRCRLIRHARREGLIATMLDACPGLHLYGSPSWARWPRFAPHYRGLIESPEELAALYRDSEATFHEGQGVHFRSLDAMASGGLLFFLEHPEDLMLGGMNTVFEPDVHFVPFRTETLADRMARYRDDRSAAAAVRKAAADAVRSAHTWQHRARAIVGDLADLG